MPRVSCQTGFKPVLGNVSLKNSCGSVDMFEADVRKAVNSCNNVDVDFDVVVMALSTPKNFRIRSRLRREVRRRTEKIAGGEVLDSSPGRMTVSENLQIIPEIFFAQRVTKLGFNV